MYWENGIGFLDVEGFPYDQNYFNKYVGYEQTILGQQLNTARLHIVEAYLEGSMKLVDVGVGSGQFVRSRPGTLGYDVNPVAIDYLKQNDLWIDPYIDKVDAASFWDSFEHIEHHTQLMANIKTYIFMSIPIFESKEHALTSKHYRPDEHYWYFTNYGLVSYMYELGFILKATSDIETYLGREGIRSFVFKREDNDS